nr:uncharacterized protein LOC125639114 [Caretta caretta]
MRSPQNRKRAPAWTKRETLDLIAEWGEESVQAKLRSKRRNANIYAKITKGMVERGYNRDTQPCRMKVKELRQAYQKTKEANGCSGSEPHTCRFFDQLHGILGGDLTTTPPLSTDTCKGGVSRNREEDFVDEEEEENAQQAGGESILPGSQYLFITLEPLPSQGGIPDPEGGGGSSGANVSMLPLSSPSLRLSQIRRQKKRTRDGMFSKLMQSCRTDRAQLNAWRHSVAEARKGLSEHEEQRQMVKLMREQTDMMKRPLELQESQRAQTPLHPLYNGLPSSKFHILLTQMSKNAQGGDSRHPATPLQGWLKQQKAVVQTVLICSVAAISNVALSFPPPPPHPTRAPLSVISLFFFLN